MHAVKFADGSDTVIEGPGIPYGGPFSGGRDLDKQYFSAKTDFAFDWFGDGARPTLFHHGLDDDAGLSVVGRVKDWEVKPDLGVWTRVQLDKQSKYFSAIKDLIDKGALYFSSGAMAHLVKVNEKSGEIQRWPWVELSLTPTPANLLATVTATDVAKHYKAAGLELPADLDLPEALAPEVTAGAKSGDGSYESLMGKLRAAINPPNRLIAEVAHSYYSEIKETYPDYVIVCRHQEDGTEGYWRVPYKVDADGNPTLGEPVQVEETYVSKRAKATPDEPPTDPARKAVVYEMLIASLQARINRYDPFGTGAQGTVEATLPGEAYVSRKCGDDVTFWRVPYALLFDGSPELGEAVEIHESDIPERDVKALPETSLTTQADTVAHYAATLAGRTKGLVERRVKEGRVLSQATRKRLTDCQGTLQAAHAAIADLLDSTDPAKAEAKAEFGRLLAEFEDIEFEIALTGAGG